MSRFGLESRCSTSCYQGFESLIFRQTEDPDQVWPRQKPNRSGSFSIRASIAVPQGSRPQPGARAVRVPKGRLLDGKVPVGDRVSGTAGPASGIRLLSASKWHIPGMAHLDIGCAVWDTPKWAERPAWPASEGRHVVDDDGSGRKLDPPKPADQIAKRQVHEPGRWIVRVSPQHRPRPSEGEHVLRLLVAE